MGPMLYVEPYAGVAPVTAFIEQAAGPLYINEYYLDQPEILRAIADAVRHGTQVDVILEQKPFGISPEMVQKEFADVQATGANVVGAPAQFSTGYVFNHAKYMVARNGAMVLTANMSNAAFDGQNREFLYYTNSPMIITALEQVARADISGNVNDVPPNGNPAALILSPNDPVAEDLSSVIQQPGSVGIETEEVQPNNPLMSVMEQKGANLSIIIPNKLNSKEQEAVSELEQYGVHVHVMNGIYMHAKIITPTTGIGQNNIGFVGSQNLSDTSLTKNREVGVFVIEPENVRIMENQFNSDWRNSSPVGSGNVSDADGGEENHAKSELGHEIEAGAVSSVAGYAVGSMLYHHHHYNHRHYDY